MYQEAELRGYLTSEEILTGTLSDTQGLSGILSAGVGAAGDYNNLINKPRINNVVIEGNKTPLQYGFPTVAVTGSYTDLVNKPSIPTKTSDLTNDSGFITEAAIPTKTSELTNDSGFITDSGLATVATTGDYDDLLNKPTIPAAQVNSDWNAISGVAKILNKPTIPAAQVNSDWNASSGVAEILNKPTIPAAQVNSDWNASSGVAQILNKPTIPTKTSELTNDSGFITNSGLATVATTGDYDDLLNKPTIPAAQVNSDWNASSGVAEILNKPVLATVATTGSYNDLTNKPTIPAAQVNSDWNASSGVAQILNKPTLATVATSGNYNDLTNKPLVYDGTLIHSDTVSAEGSISGFTCTGYKFVKLRIEGNTSNTQDYLIPVGGTFKVAAYIWATASINAYVPLELDTTTGVLTVRAIRLATWGSVMVYLYGIF